MSEATDAYLAKEREEHRKGLADALYNADATAPPEGVYAYWLLLADTALTFVARNQHLCEHCNQCCDRCQGTGEWR